MGWEGSRVSPRSRRDFSCQSEPGAWSREPEALLRRFILFAPRRGLRSRHDAREIRIFFAGKTFRPFCRLGAPLGLLLPLFLLRAFARSLLLADFRFGHAVSDGSRSLRHGDHVVIAVDSARAIRADRIDDWIEARRRPGARPIVSELESQTPVRHRADECTGFRPRAACQALDPAGWTGPRPPRGPQKGRRRPCGACPHSTCR